MRKIALALAVPALALCCGGCGGEAEREAESLRAELAVLRAENSVLQGGVDSLQAKLTALSEVRERLARERDKLAEEVERLRAAAASTSQPEAAQADSPGLPVAEVRDRLAELARLAFERGDFDMARTVARNAARLGDASARLRYIIACASAEAGDDEEAMKWHQQALAALDAAEEPDPALRVRALNNCAAALLRLQRAERAARMLKEAATLEPDFAPLYFNLGLAYARHLDRPADAVEALRLHVAHGGSRSETARELIRELQRGRAPSPES